MNEILDTTRLGAFATAAGEWLDTHVLHTHVLVQFALIALAWGLAWGAARALRPRLAPLAGRLPAWLTGAPAMSIASRQFAPLLFVVALSLETTVMRAITWPSHSYLMSVVATLTLVWLVIRMSTTVIRNRLLAGTLAGLLWLLAALSITGKLRATLDVLDGYAFSVGELDLTVLSLLQGTLLLVMLIWGSLALSRALEARLQRSSEIAPSARALLGLTLRIGLVSLSVVIGLNSVGIDLTALAVLSGAVGIGIGFGLQKVISNLISGVILLLDRSIKPGDVIQLGDTFGWITHLGARYVSLVTRDGKEYLVPNEDLITQQVVNWSYSDDLVRLETTIRAAYDADPHHVRQVAVEAARLPARVRNLPAPVCHLRSFGDSSLEYLLRFWIVDPKNGVENITGEVLLAVWDAFRREGIAVPFPQQDLHLRTPLTAAPAPAPDGTG